MSKVLVVGDQLQDVYVQCTADRVSPEAPVLVLKPSGGYTLPGGAGNVGRNLRSLEVETKEYLPEQMPNKIRYMVGTQQVIRVDEGDYCEPVDLEKVKEDIPLVDAIVVSDYAKGTVSPELLELFKNTENLPPVFLDTKSNPLPWLTIANVVFPNMKEYEAYPQEYDAFPNCVVKLGGEGLMRLVYGESVQFEQGYDVVVRSVVGAGDSVLATWVAKYLESRDVELATRYANAAGAVSVRGEMTTAVGWKEIEEVLGK